MLVALVLRNSLLRDFLSIPPDYLSQFLLPIFLFLEYLLPTFLYPFLGIDQNEIPYILHNDSHKFESGFVNVTIQPNHSVMLKSLAGSRLGIWIAHGEGKFSLPYAESEYHIPIKYSYDAYPGNPNGSDYSVAALASADGRHLAIMPHLERSIFPWQNGYYPENRIHNDEVTPWIEAFVNARKWVEEKTNKR